MAEPMSESERRAAYEVAAAHLPTVRVTRVWSDREIDVLRKACAVRFDESLRTETLMWIAVAAMRIAKSWEQQ